MAATSARILTRSRSLFGSHPRHMAVALQVAQRVFTVRRRDFTFQGKDLQRQFASNVQGADSRFPTGPDKPTDNGRLNNLAKSSARTLLQQGIRWQAEQKRKPKEPAKQ